MADERHYIIRLTDGEGFDGETPATPADSWLPLPKGQSDQKYRSLTITDGTRGLFGPDVLGGPVKGTRLVRVFTDGEIEDGDRYWTVGSATEVGPGSLVEADPVSVVREPAVTMTTRPSGAHPLELGPTDQLAIETMRPTTAHIIVTDLDEDEVYDWTARLADRAAADRPVTSRAVAAATTVDAWEGLLFLAVTAATAGDTLTLPLLEDIALGDEVFIYRDGGAWFQVDGNGTEEINGNVRTVRFLNDGEGEVFKKSAFGWVSTGDATSTTVVTLTDDNLIATPARARTHILWTVTASAVLTLPDIALVPIDAEIDVTLFSVTGGTRFIVQPTAAQNLNGTTRPEAFANVGDSAIFRRVDQGWISVTNANDVDQASTLVTADPLLALVKWRGVRFYRCTYAAGPGDFTLTTSPLEGQELVVWQTNANAVTLQAGANTIAAAATAAATKALTQNVPMRLKFSGGVWWGT